MALKRVTVDLMDLHSCTGGNQYVRSIVDRLTWYLQLSVSPQAKNPFKEDLKCKFYMTTHHFARTEK